MLRNNNKKSSLILRKLRKMHRIVVEERSVLEKEVNGLPEGMLHVRKSYDYYKYYVKRGNDVKSVRKSNELVSMLARKAFAVEELVETTRLEEILHEAIVKIEQERKRGKGRGKITIERLMELFAEESYHINIREKKWLKRHPQVKGLYPESRKYKTKSGLIVRSKSERMIADLLDEYGIIYRYEARIDANGKIMVPDFLILRFDGAVIAWEHFGLMNDENYRKNAKQKMEQYNAIGFNTNINLICTTEDDMLSEDDIRKIIEERLL